jgi:hypothetical protein
MIAKDTHNVITVGSPFEFTHFTAAQLMVQEFLFLDDVKKLSIYFVQQSRLAPTSTTSGGRL